MSLFVGATSNQRQMRLWHLAGRDREVAPTEERVAFGQPIYKIMSYHYLEMVLLASSKTVTFPMLLYRANPATYLR